MTNDTSGFKAATLRMMAIFVAIVALWFVQTKYNIIPMPASQKAVVPTAIDLPTASTESSKPSVTELPLPGTALSKVSGPEVRINVWAWNAQIALFLSNGGPQTTVNSLMDKYGVRVRFARQDDTSKSQPEQVKFASLLANGNPNPAEGIHFVVIMGDGAATYLATINKTLTKLGPDYRAEIVGAVGYSRGEDAFMGPPEWKDHPETAKGGLVAGVLRDGDWNIAQYWLAQNNLPNNPDEKYYDPNALNWYATDDYIKAAEAYTTGTDTTHGVCEDRTVVKDGKTTTQKAHVCVQGVVTWTPGDVNIAKAKGGLVKILSTKDNAYQMPAVLIGIHKWDMAHAKQVQGILAASFEAADQVKTYDTALARGAKASVAIYCYDDKGQNVCAKDENTPAYWVKYYKGATERDKGGNPVSLGGSTVMNLADNLLLFGLSTGAGDEASSMFRATYEGFGGIAKQQYPALVPDFPKVTEVVNTTFLKALMPTMPAIAPEVQTFEARAKGVEGLVDVVAKRNWSVQFDTGKSTFTPAAQATLDQLFNQLAVGAGLAVEIDGHADNQGAQTLNQQLSLDRANAVKMYLEGRAPLLFPENRIVTKAFGDTQPVATNATPEGRAQNRRVAIILSTK